MRRVLLTMLFAMVLLASGIGTATAEPQKTQKNQIEVTVSCGNAPESEYTLVFNAMSKTGQVSGSMSNVVVKSGMVTFSPTDGTQPITDEIGGQGNKEGLQGDLITCHGQTTTDLLGLGTVTAVFDFQGFITPRGK